MNRNKKYAADNGLNIKAIENLSDSSLKYLTTYIDIAKNCGNAENFVHTARKIKECPMELSKWLYSQYNPNGALSPLKTSERFMGDINTG